jgi:copper transport protein
MIDRRFAPPPSGALRSRRVKRLVVLFAVASLASPAAAFAHATLLRTAPADGAVLAAAPRHVTIFFDDTIRAGKGNAAIANGSKRSVLAGPATAHGHNLVLPLRRLRDGDYSVRWSIVSDDGHPESGVLAFAVGAGRAPPTALLDATTHSSWSGVLERTLFLLGLLTAGGAAVFGFQARPVLGGRLTLPLAQLIFFSLLVAFLGGSALLRAATAGTRYDHVLKVAIVVSIVGGAAAALAPVYPRLLDAASLCALVLLAAPTLGGHALDRDQPRLLSVPADLAHVVGAAIWLGGLITLVTVLPRVRADDSERQLVVPRFSTTAFVAVCVLSAAGLARAVTELHSVSQVWSTSYGRVLIVKSVLLLPLLGLGWLNRTRLLGAFTRLRRSATVEVLLLGCIVVAVAVLVELRPGTAEARRAQPSVASPATATLPSSRTAVVDARGIAGLAVGLARVPGSATVTIIGPDGSAAAGESVAINGRAATSCGNGCYRAAAGAGPVRVRVRGREATFHIPATAPDATAQLRALTKRYRAARTIVFDESLSATGRGGIQSRFTAVAPNRLAYQIRGGSSAIVIGPRRWDRDAAGKPFVESPQTPLDVTDPTWTTFSNVHEVAPGVLTFLDRGIPAWFRVTLAGPLPRTLHMTAAAHFMTEHYVGFDVPATVSPPSR